jgi:uncharacterized protein (DUF305 family)
VLASVAFRSLETSTPEYPRGQDVVRALAGAATQAEFDLLFIDMMVPHHQGAVEMALIAQVRGEHQEVKEMAAAILADQTREIEQMRAWRLAWYGSAQTPPMDQMPMLHDAPQAGTMAMTMNMAQEVEILRNAPEPFDQAFINAMIPHHQSAIDAALLAQTRAQRHEIRDLAAAILRAQQSEIDQMQAWQQAWYGAAASPTGDPSMPTHTPGMGH